MTTWEVYIDGSVRNNGQENARGGIGVYIKRGPTEKSIARPLLDGVTPTSPRAELWALIAAIRIALTHNPKPETLYIYSDSEYVIDAWERGRIWEAKATAPPSNWELIERLNRLYLGSKTLGVKIGVMKVKAHAASQGNKMADKLATWAADHQRLSDAQHEKAIVELLAGRELTRDQSAEAPIKHEP